MVNKIKTLKNLNKKFPRFQLETLLTIIDCIEDEVTVFPITTQNQTSDSPIKPIFEPPFNPTCDNRVTSTTDNYNPTATLVATGEPFQEHYGYCKYSETSNVDGKEETNEVVATDDNGSIHVYVNGDDCGIEFPPRSKKQHHLCDKTSCNVNIITDESKTLLEEFLNDDIIEDLKNELSKKIFE